MTATEPRFVRPPLASNPLELVGNTPLVRIRHLVAPGGAALYGKCEQLNPGGSVKDRIARHMMAEAEAEGRVQRGSLVVEPTSGNTGIGLAIVCAIRGYRCLLVMPDNMSHERRSLLEAYGAELVLTPEDAGMHGAVEVAERIVAEQPSAFMPMQFANPANPRAHEETTGPEIAAALAGRSIDAFVAGVGTGGTITGVGRCLRRVNPKLMLVGVEPTASPVLTGGRPGVHGIQGIGAGFVPAVLDRALLDDVMTVSEEEALRTRALLARREGLFVGISAGAAVYAAAHVASRLGPEQTVVTVLCDTGERYLSG